MYFVSRRSLLPSQRIIWKRSKCYKRLSNKSNLPHEKQWVGCKEDKQSEYNCGLHAVVWWIATALPVSLSNWKCNFLALHCIMASFTWAVTLNRISYTRDFGQVSLGTLLWFLVEYTHYHFVEARHYTRNSTTFRYSTAHSPLIALCTSVDGCIILSTQEPLSTSRKWNRTMSWCASLSLPDLSLDLEIGPTASGSQRSCSRICVAAGLSQWYRAPKGRLRYIKTIRQWQFPDNSYISNSAVRQHKNLTSRPIINWGTLSIRLATFSNIRGCYGALQVEASTADPRLGLMCLAVHQFNLLNDVLANPAVFG